MLGLIVLLSCCLICGCPQLSIFQSSALGASPFAELQDYLNFVKERGSHGALRSQQPTLNRLSVVWSPL